MSDLSFFPLGIYFSSSYSVSSSLTNSTVSGGIPTTASVAEYVINYTGPTGPSYVTVNAIVN